MLLGSHLPGTITGTGICFVSADVVKNSGRKVDEGAKKSRKKIKTEDISCKTYCDALFLYDTDHIDPLHSMIKLMDFHFTSGSSSTAKLANLEGSNFCY